MKTKRMQSVFVPAQKAMFDELRERFDLKYTDLIGPQMSASTANRIVNGCAVDSFHMAIALYEVRDWLRRQGHGDLFDEIFLRFANDGLDYCRCHG